jgi:hypothetical protein
MTHPSESAVSCSRRDALARLAAGGLAACSRTLLATPAEQQEELTFFVIADPQIHLDKWGTAGTEKMIELINALPGKDFPLGG